MKPGYKQTEVGVIPEDWEVNRLGDLARFITSGSRGWAQFYSDAGALFIRSQNIGDGRLCFDDKQHVSPPSDSEGSRTKVEQNDVLITITGNSVGNVAFAEQAFDEAYISQHVGLVRLKQPETGSYICRYLSPNSPGNPQISGSQSGQSKPGLNLQNLRDFWIASPRTTTEQRAIAEALSDVDGLLGGLDRLIAKKRDLKQAAMQQLLTAQTRLPGCYGRWVKKRLADIAPLQRGFDLPNPQLKHGPYPVVYSNGILNYHVSYQVKGPGVVTGRSGTIGRVTFLEEDYWPHNTSLWVTTFKGNDPKFIFYLYTKLGLEQFATGSGVPTLNRNDVHAFQFSIPSTVAEQTAIAEVLGEIDGELAALERRREKTRALKQAMMQQLLTGQTRIV
ncbi:restriction endonuclease subunit S [Horticoccus sp. 23ND18S-11]|uniref:restriction endonuclease subunit S n=1 Tax=Horticoccus sp. 23ND18S-11 TaxID=3391832 RepID=UPI0039C905F3